MRRWDGNRQRAFEFAAICPGTDDASESRPGPGSAVACTNTVTDTRTEPDSDTFADASHRASTQLNFRLALLGTGSRPVYGVRF